MHELGITQNIVAIALEHAEGKRVERVVLEIGQLSAILPEAIQFCFDVCCQGTALEGAALEIIAVPGRGHCQDCGAEVAMDLPFGICDRCGSQHLTLIQGQELNLKALEVESLCA